MRVATRQLPWPTFPSSPDMPSALDEGAVQVLGTTIREAVEVRLARFPEMGKAGHLPGTRELVLTRINVVVAYRVDGEELWVLSVLRAEHE